MNQRPDVYRLHPFPYLTAKPPAARGVSGTPRPAKGLGLLGSRCFMTFKRTPDERHNWYLAIVQIAKEPKEYYRASTTGELPPQLLALSKKIDEELQRKYEQ